MAESRILWDDHGAVLKAYRLCRKFFHVIRGPLAGRKTRVSIMKIIEMLCQQHANGKKVRNSRIAIVRNTYPDLISTTIHDWRSALEELKLGKITMGHPPTHLLDFDLPDGTTVKAEVIFLALDKPEDVRKLRGLNLTFAYVNEMKEIPWAIIEMLFGRVDRYPSQGGKYNTYAGVFGDTNSWDTEHDLEKQAKKYADSEPDSYERQNYEFFVQPGAVQKVNGEWKVNPDRENSYFVDEKYYERQVKINTEDFIKVNLANEIGFYVDGRPVHSQYSDSYHGANVELIPTPGSMVYVGLDFGLTPAAAFIQKQPDGQWWVFDEITSEDGDAASLAAEVKVRASEWIGRVGLSDGRAQLVYMYRGDPSGDNRAQTDRTTPFQIMRGANVPAFPASTNDPVIRRAALTKPLERNVKGKPGILFSTRVQSIRKGLSGAWCYKRIQGSTNYRDVPDKGKYSHVCEGLEYALMDAGEHAVINAAPGGTTRSAIRTVNSWDPFAV